MQTESRTNEKNTHTHIYKWSNWKIKPKNKNARISKLYDNEWVSDLWALAAIRSTYANLRKRTLAACVLFLLDLLLYTYFPFKTNKTNKGRAHIPKNLIIAVPIRSSLLLFKNIELHARPKICDQRWWDSSGQISNILFGISRKLFWFFRVVAFCSKPEHIWELRQSELNLIDHHVMSFASDHNYMWGM